MDNKNEFRLIGAGIARTGTMSTKYALEMILPGKCYHMIEAMNEQDVWVKILDNRTTDEAFASHFMSNGYVSAVDAPFAMCYEQALRSYPNAKVLLNVRDPEGWVSSIKNTIIASETIQNEFPIAIFKWLGLGSSYLMLNNSKMFSKALENQRCNEMIEAVKNDEGVEYFNKWIDDVKTKVSGEKLLVFNVKEGWGPLCKFLNVPVPEQPFPRINDTNAFKERFNRTRRRSWLLLYEFITIPALLYALYTCIKKK